MVFHVDLVEREKVITQSVIQPQDVGEISLANCAILQMMV